MGLKATNFYIQLAPLPPTFEGTPQELATAIVKRLRILSPSGTNFIFIGDVEPVSNVGPWLRGGTKWYVFDDDLKRYVPLDISDSEKHLFWFQSSTPSSSDPPLWLRSTQDPTDVDPSPGVAISWYVFDGSSWIPFNSIPAAGPTTSRPANPTELQQFYDTDIGVLIWFERGQWRTVSGVPGDVKSVVFERLTDALRVNPGWDVLGSGNQAFRGRIVMEAAKDAGATPETVLTVGANLTARAAQETFGEETGVQVNNASSVRYPGQIALWHLVKL